MKRKGQSSIEYLTTYGWMILAVAVVTTFAYANIDSTCTRSFSDVYTDTVSVEDFGLSGTGDMAISFKNEGYNELEIKYINVTIRDEYKYHTLGLALTPGEKDTVEVSGYESASGCNNLEVDMEIDRGGLSDQDASGVIRAPIEFQ